MKHHKRGLGFFLLPYLAVKTPGTLQAGQTFSLQPGSRGMSIAQAFSGKRGKHLR
jgi:hypothetical protein